MVRVRLCLAAGFVSLALVSTPAAAQIDARMLRYPTVSQTSIAFVYAGDVWTVARTGGTAFRLTSSPGEELLPRFSPDGTKLAYSAEYDGNVDVYVVPTTGGEPTRLTHHPMDDRVVGWHPDGERVLFASGRESGRQRYSQFYLVSERGGLPEKLPVPYGEFGDIAADGTRLAYMPLARDFRTWKRYRGGWAPDIWVFDLTTFASRNLTAHAANDAQPMWHGDVLYFLSDRGEAERSNIWALDTASGALRQVTHLTDFDITFPSIGPDAIVYQAGGRLYLLDLATEESAEVSVRVVTDRTTLRPRTARATDLITSVAVSPTGKRAVVEARGDIVTLPAEHGAVLNVTRSSGVAERYPRWSPDGRLLAYWTDASGEYELAVRPADGSGELRTLTSLGAGYRYTPHWSPDCRSIAFIDQAMRMRLVEVESGAVVDVDVSEEFMSHGQLEQFRFAWSADSRWLTWARRATTRNNAIFLFDTQSKTRSQVTSGYLNDEQPVFDPAGKYLYYASDRTFDPVYSSFDNSWTYTNPTRLVAVPLRADVESPLKTRHDAETDAGDTSKAAEKGDEDDADKKAEDTTKQDVTAVDIDLEGFEWRAVVLPPAAGRYADLQAAEGKVVYRRLPRRGASGTDSPVVYYDLAERKEETVLDVAGRAELTADGKKLLVAHENELAIIELKPAQKFDKPLATADVEVPVDPRAEWTQMFDDAYRFERDFFYDPNMHGVDWDAMRDRYRALLDDAVTRWDVNVVLGELIGELNASHTYRGGGDEERAPRRNVGLLGVDWAIDGGAYRIARVVRGGPWDTARSPLDEPGVDVSEGDYVLAVNGVPLDVTRDPWASFQGLGVKTVLLTVNDRPSTDGARQVAVTTIDDETPLRFAAWIEERRQVVDEATGGRVGYIYVQSTGVDAQNDLVRQFMAQWQKPGLVIDERWNSGGQIPDRFIELLNRPILAYWAVRDGHSWQWPPVAHRGPQVMLINGWSGSGGDALPTYFRQAGLGPLIGSRTWGGLIGLSGSPRLVDGGTVTVPTFRMFGPDGQWFAEGHGVEPDIPVAEDPTALARGTDPQLQRAIEEVLERVEQMPAVPERPAYERRVSAATNGGGAEP